MRVLIADDDPAYRSLLAGLLTKWKFEVVLAVNGVEAMEVMRRENPPQLLVLDWEMPEMDGFEVARTIRNEDAGRDAYILMIAGGRKKEDMKQILVCGADDYLIKPFDPMDLEIHLRSALRILHLREELNELKQARQGETISLT